ncbi:MAG: HAMP domain-containing histidine kinase [Epsilonproteobacteria bacterium]|nr:HAMP domain-containing histidine kinase [Campylobacterota bacterium]
MDYQKRVRIKDFKHSSFMASIIIMFLLIGSVGYMLLRDNIITNHEKDTKILFYEIQTHTSDMLTDLLYQYDLQKNVLIEKHKMVTEYLRTQSTKPQEIDLNSIRDKINEDCINNPFNIYISDKNLVIKNTTYEKDIGFDLSFAKTTFDEHFDNNMIGVCTPLFEKSSKQFFSYTDSYLDRNKSGVLQISYVFDGSKNKLLDIQNLIAKHPNIVDAKAYMMVDTGFVNDIILKDYPSYKPDLKEILARIDDGSQINNKLMNTNLTIDGFTKDGILHKAIFLATRSAISDNSKIVYSLLLDESVLQSKLRNLNIFIFLIAILGIIAIFITGRIRTKEIKLSEQDAFVQSSMHEIKTPLSIITLNNELRGLEFGEDEYSQEIESAIKTLKTSYDDMSFTITKDKFDYPIELLNLSEVVEERVEYFKTIAKSKSKSITLKTEGNCNLKISKVELIRIIDNNLSNAIKYSDVHSVISVTLENNLLSFHNMGKPIKDTKHIFDKYFRENSVVGGHGLGLSIVSDIAKKYFIAIVLDSSTEDGTTFTYKFKCHTDDISSL